MLEWRGAEMKLAPNSLLSIGDPSVLHCGSVAVVSGEVVLNEGPNSITVQAGQSFRSSATGCADPSFWRARRRQTQPLPATQERPSGGPSVWRDPAFLTVTGAMISSSVVNAELTMKCLDQQTCKYVPSAFRSRPAMYSAGFAAEAGVIYTSYRLKRARKKWWFVPSLLVTGANIYVATHAAKRAE